MGARTLALDIETFSDVDLKRCGVYRYVEGDFRILLLAYAFEDDACGGDEEVYVIDLANGEPIPPDVLAAIEDPMIRKTAWNAQFERVCIGHHLGKVLSPDSWYCTMCHAASLSLPLALKNAAAVLKVEEQKDKTGEGLIRFFSMPCKPTKANGGRTRNLPEHAADKWWMFKRYCAQDVRTERAIRQRLERFTMSDTEWNYYHMDQRINDRGVLIDMDLVRQAITCDLMLSEAMTKQAYELTGLENPNSVSQLKEWLDSRGIEMDSLGKKNVAAMITDLDKGGLDQEALDVLQLRLKMAKSSIKKYQAAERCACQDGRARGLFQFCGAGRTARFAGRFIQLQNLVRNSIPTLNEARELVKMGCFDMVESIYGNTPDILSQLIRTMLIPKPGCEFIIADFSAIEARVLAWEAGEQWRLDAFANGEDIYCASASQMFGVPVVKHGVNGELRQRGKVSELACIAEGQLVLTDVGLVPIQDVTKDMKLWDGEEWVSHDGVVCRGRLEVMTYEGLTATPDHLVFTEGQSRPMWFTDAAYYGKNLRRPQGDKTTTRTGTLPQRANVYDIINAGPRHRFTVSGCLVHNCGYQGGTGALIAMGALDMGLKKSELPELIENWRDANPNIVQYWHDVENAAIATVSEHKERKVRFLTFQFDADTLWMGLPSGRRIAYMPPRLQPNRFGHMALTFEGVDRANGWSRQETYGGRAVENAPQGIARDLLVEAMWRLERAGFDIVAHVHDEVIIESPIGAHTVEEVCGVMNQSPEWCRDLPLSSDGYTGSYYFKS